MVLYGQVVVGPPGSGKTTYCNGMQQYLRLVGRETLVVNLDPANERAALVHPRDNGEAHDGNVGEWEIDKEDREEELPYETLLDVCDEIIGLSSVVENLGLGPNGGLVYSMEYIEKHFDHVLALIRERLADSGCRYLLFDLPGQAELYTHCTCVQSMLRRLTKELDIRLAAVHLIDAHYCSDATKFLSAALLSTASMIRLELPAVNVLSKVDLIASMGGTLPYNLEFFTECQELNRLTDYLDADPVTDNDYGSRYADDPEYQAARRRTRNSAFHRRHRRLHASLCEVIDDFGLLSYVPLNISDASSVGRVVARIDKCNGYVFQQPDVKEEGGVQNLFQCAVQAESAGWEYEAVSEVHERFLGTWREEVPELEQSPKHCQDIGRKETDAPWDDDG